MSGGLFSTEWSFYRHRIVIHEQSYLDPSNGTHTQTIDRAWVEIRVSWRHSRGNKRNLQSHLNSIVCSDQHRTKRNSSDLLDQYLSDVRRVHEIDTAWIKNVKLLLEWVLSLLNRHQVADELVQPKHRSILVKQFCTAVYITSNTANLTL